MTSKKVKWMVALVVVCALGIWTSSRWDAWFHNPEENPYYVGIQPCRILLTLGDSSELSRNVSWQCDSILHPSSLQLVSLADSDTIVVEPQGEVFRSRSGQAAHYVARLRHLKADAHYAYRVVTNGNSSPWYDFHTYPTRRNHAAFLYVGDVQDSIGGQAGHYLREALKRHPLCELTVCGGDLVERPADQYWAETFRELDSIVQHIPLLNATGNHDYLKGLPMKLERRFPLVFSYFLDSMQGNNQVYTTCYGPIQFFVLDSNRELPYLFSQRQWLEQALSQSQAMWKILIIHHPLYSLKGNNNLIQRWIFKGVIEKYGVDLVLQAHEHAYARMTRHDDSGRAVTPVYTVSHCSPKNYLIQFDKRFDKFGISQRYYQVMEACADTLTVAAYVAYDHSLYDSLRIVKQPGTGATVIEDYGQSIPEYMEYTPSTGSKKERDFAERVKNYREGKR